MRIITSINGLLRSLAGSIGQASGEGRFFTTGLPAIDALAPGGGFVRGAVHEVLCDDARLGVLPILLAKVAAGDGAVMWCDFERVFYPPAAARMGLPLDRLVVVRPANKTDELWAVNECLRCKGVSVCVAPVNRLSRVQARRIQLAAETGGGIGLLLRPASALHTPYAAATRWWVQSVRGERTVQRWSVELIHGHGGRVGQTVLLERCRETHHVRAVETVVHRSGQPQTTKIATA